MKRIHVIILLLMLVPFGLQANKWGRVVSLDGLWQFTVGDNPKWADIDCNTANWDKILVPGQWENYYPGYNGYAWYRRTFDVKSFPGDGPLYLMLGQIDDVDEVFINGVKVGQTGAFMPNFVTKYDIERVYILPDGLLKATNNVIAIRVYDIAGPGGIVSGNRIGIFYDNDKNLLSLDLSGKWKFSIYRQKGVADVGFNDKDWDEINVPGTWESQDYDGYDGYAWYRTKFILPSELENQELYLVLGKIDDFDKVYLNGKLVGRAENLENYSNMNRGRTWQLYRVYPISPNQLRKINELVVEVFDEQLDGGIYEGPIGLMKPNNARILLDRNNYDFWDNPVRGLFRLFEIY